MGNFKYKLKEIDSNILKPNEVDQALIKRIKTKYGPMDMENDFFSKDLKTYITKVRELIKKLVVLLVK
jgi:hypothetical protein